MTTARRSRNQTQLQRLKPIQRNLASAGLKPGPPRGAENSTRSATNLKTSSTECNQFAFGFHPRKRLEIRAQFETGRVRQGLLGFGAKILVLVETGSYCCES
jgi:hypothetical protein